MLDMAGWLTEFPTQRTTSLAQTNSQTLSAT